MSDQANMQRVEPFWNAFLHVDQDQGTALSELITPNVQFRGSLGVSVQGIDGIIGYCQQAKRVFEGFHITVGEITGNGDLAAARLVFSGVHREPLLGIAPTGKPIEYDGMAWMRLEDGRFCDVWVMGDAAEWIGLFRV